MKNRCEWCRNTFDQYVQYHDEEWGVPVHDEKTHFEFLIYFLLLQVGLKGQIPVYDYVEFEPSLIVPESINSERTAIIVHVPDRIGSYKEVGEWKQVAEQVHKAFVKMGIDAVFYLNHYALEGEISKNNYKELFDSRRIKNIIFITEGDLGFELLMCQYSGTSAFYLRESLFSTCKSKKWMICCFKPEKKLEGLI